MISVLLERRGGLLAVEMTDEGELAGGRVFNHEIPGPCIELGDRDLHAIDPHLHPRDLLVERPG